MCVYGTICVGRNINFIRTASNEDTEEANIPKQKIEALRQQFPLGWCWLEYIK